MKTLTSWLTISCLHLLIATNLQAAAFDKSTAAFVKLLPAQEASKTMVNHYLSASEQDGIALLNNKGKVLASLPNNAEHLDFQWLPKQKDIGVLSTVDKNTGEILLIEVNLANATLTPRTSLASFDSAIEAVCLSANLDNVDLFTIDSAGFANHYSVYQSTTAFWQTMPINRFPVGPNMKACTVDNSEQALFITEENIGIWRYSTNPEHEIIRQLYQLPKDLEIEYVDSTLSGDVGVVSPDNEAIWLLNKDKDKFEAHPLAQSTSPKTLQLTRKNNRLIAYIFDDKTEFTRQHELKTSLPVASTTEEPIDALLPYAQTTPVESFGDAADDPEIWYNEASPSASLIYTTDKKRGLNVYNLSGNLVTTLPVGRINNVDIRYDVKLGHERVDIAAASNRTSKSITLFKIDRNTGHPSYLTDIPTDLSDPYGLCMSMINQQLSVWINDTDGRFQGYNLEINRDVITGVKAQEWQVPSQPEGCVVDDETQRLFYGEESTGVWLKKLNDTAPDQLIAGLEPTIEADIEGMSLYKMENENYLVVSSQGNNRYAVYAVDRRNKLLGVFNVGANWQKKIDGASETDGLAVTSLPLGVRHPYGLLVVQDGHNVMPKATQNFKLINGTLLQKWIKKKLSN